MRTTITTLALSSLLALPGVAADPDALRDDAAATPTTTAPTTAPTTEATTAPPTTASPTATAVAETIPPTIHERGGLFGLGLVVTPKLGGALGALALGGPGATLTPSLELGWLLPLPQPVGRDLQLTVAGSYAAPSLSQSVAADDPRLADGTFTFDLTMHQWSLTTGLLYRVPVPLEWLRPTASLALQTLYTRTVVGGDSSGSRFPTTLEDAVDVGVLGGLGADLFVGPGAISAELQASWAPADHVVVQDASSTSLGVLLGYRFFL